MKLITLWIFTEINIPFLLLVILYLLLSVLFLPSIFTFTLSHTG